jgi:hypothetical protein
LVSLCYYIIGEEVADSPESEERLWESNQQSDRSRNTAEILSAEKRLKPPLIESYGKLR